MIVYYTNYQHSKVNIIYICMMVIELYSTRRLNSQAFTVP